jgi:ABC-type Zn uptake system ZnuABC Zn-binding protein ZnuA
MISMKSPNRLFVLLLTVGIALPIASEATVKVVTTQETYAAIARELGGGRVNAESIVPGVADAHFVKPKPSYAFMLRDADLFVSTGLDLELWAPVLVNKSGNRNIADGAAGYVAAAHGIDLLDKPASADRSHGDVHIFGNPHIQTSPINASIVATNIATGLCKVDPAGCEIYRSNLTDFNDRLARSLYGNTLVELLGVETLDSLAANGRLVSFLEEKGFADKIGGWLEEAMPFRGSKLVCYHKNWIYFTTLFGLEVVGFVETKPGIPPTARHVAELIQRIDDEDVGVLLAANYFEKRKPELISKRTGIVPVIAPMSVGGDAGVETYFDLVDTWIERLLHAYHHSEEAQNHPHDGEKDHHDVQHRN